MSESLASLFSVSMSNTCLMEIQVYKTYINVLCIVFVLSFVCVGSIWQTTSGEEGAGCHALQPHQQLEEGIQEVAWQGAS